MEEVFLFVFVFVLLTIVGTIYILSSAVILQCLKDFYQEYSQKNNLFLEPIILKTPKAPFQNPSCDRRDDTNYVLDHTYALPIATQPYIIDNEPLSIYSEIEIDTEVGAVQNEVLFDYIPSDLVPLSHCRFIVDLGFMAEQLKHSILSVNPSCLLCLGG